MEDLGIDFPFQLTISHPALTMERMMEMSRLLDFHEVREADPRLEKARHDLIVDVLAVHTDETVVEIKPRRAMTYDAIMAELRSVLDTVAERFEGKVKVTKLDWLVDRKGMASDLRIHQKRVI